MLSKDTADEAMQSGENSKKQIRVDQMTLEQKRELLSKFDHTPFLKVGTYVDATDTTFNYLLAKIIQVDNNMAYVNFDGWSDKWNCWQRFNKIMPYRSKAKGYSGQKKTAIRKAELKLEDLQRHYQNVTQLINQGLEGLSAHDFTQYVSGELFIFIDVIFNDNKVDQTMLPQIDQFIKLCLRLIVTWLNKIPTLQVTLDEMEAVPQLFLVDPKAAIVESYTELMETLGKLFGTCMRALCFFMLNDTNQAPPQLVAKEVSPVIPNSFGVVVQNLTQTDFVARRLENEQKFAELVARGGTKDKKDVQYGFMLNWVQYFASLGGFNAVLNLLSLGLENEKATKVPFHIISMITRPFKHLGCILAPEFAAEFSQRIADLIVKRLATLSEKDVKVCNKDQVDQVMYDLDQVISIGMDQKERSKLVELTELSIGLRFVKSNTLEKRIKGLQDIRLMIERVVKTQNLMNLKRANNWQEEIDKQNVQLTGHLNVRLMSDWLKQNKILELIFGQGSHLEIVKRSPSILKFIARYSQDMFDIETVELIWKCQEGKHEEMIRTVYNIIENVLPYLSLDVINLFFQKVSQVPRVDEKYIVFLKQFTLTALEKQYKTLEMQWSMQQEEISESDDYAYSFDACLIRQEQKMIDNIQDFACLLQNNDLFVNTPNNQYGIPIFWNICKDGSQQTKEIREMALKAILEMFTQGFRKTNRLYWLALGLEQLMQSKSLVQSIKVVKGVIKSYNIDQTQRMQYVDEEPQLIQVLQHKIQYLNQVVQLLLNYHNHVKQQLKSLDQVPNEEDDPTFIGLYSHTKTLQTLLNHIRFLVENTQVNLGISNIDKLWSVFVDQPNYQKEQAMFISWINRSKENTQKVFHEMFNAEEKKYIFLQILCPQVAKQANLNLARCFAHYFVQINKADGALKKMSKRLKVIDFQKVQGLDALWQISLNCTNQKARDLCQDLLVNLYLKQQINQQLLASFVDQCMQDVTKEGVVSLLSTFLDRYEGIKELKIEADLQRRIPGLKPVSIKVQSLMSDPQQIKTVGLTYYQSLGHLRKFIAEAFQLQQNEFQLLLKNQVLIDPEVDDDKFMRDFPGMFQFVTIKRNSLYDPMLHPKYLLSENEEYFERIFDLLKTSPVAKLDTLYNLFQKLPVSKSLRQSFVSLQKVKEAQTEQERCAQWTELLDPTSMFKLLYCMQIINGLIAQEDGKQWLEQFIDLGGFLQLVKCLVELNMTEVDSMLKLKCLKDIIGLLQLLLAEKVQILNLIPKEMLIHKLFDYIKMICDFSIKSESLRGYSYEVLKKRIEAARLRKLSNKLHTLNAKNDKKAEDDEGDSEDKILYETLLREFKDQTEVVSNMFNVLKTISSVDSTTINQVIGDLNLSDLLIKGLLQSEDPMLRNCVSIRIFELLYPTTLSQQVDTLKNNSNHIVQVIMQELSLVPISVKHQARCYEFYKHLSSLISNADHNLVLLLSELAIPTISKLADLIIHSEIKESNTQDTDYLMQGSLMLLATLLQKFPQQKRTVGQVLISHLVHDCLFEIPHGSKGGQNQCAPKCKSWQTRQHALNLVNVLSRDCFENLQFVLNYLSNFNQEATWRTSKETDWAIKLYNDEKSSTGHVGIKNLACICYMNSLNQQLFMIPTLRNDLLSIKDPNHDNQPDEDNMFLQWQTLFTGLLLSEKMYCNPKGFCHAFKDWEGNPTNVIEQMDVDEYLNMLFDRLENAIKGTPQAKTIQYHFGGELANEIICKTCPHQYERKETFLTIGISVKNKKSIVQGLDSFVKDDVLDESNQYMCEKCDKKVDALKRACIKKLPRYLITSFKRFEFDLDQMIRIKVNDFCEFPFDLDMTPYTQEYLSKKAKGGEFEMKHPADYYNYELVGIVVHSGTADSGHYYSYIKEQERFDKSEPEKWYEFNDTLVRDFDKNDIPSECFGGVEQAVGWGTKGYVKTANAYIVVYKRKLEETPPDSDDESGKKPQNEVVEILGQKQLILPTDSAIAQKIGKSNHKYWQNRFLFSQEYTEFVCQLTANWNTNFIIPAHSINRNDDAHLYAQMGTLQTQFELAPMTLIPPQDVSLPLESIYTQEQICQQQFNVFKFAASHYISVMQRSEDKQYLPTMVKYLKSYINYNAEWAQWLLKQFVNVEVLKECFLDNSNKLMRSILGGILYCAMLKTYEIEKASLNNYWNDIKFEAQSRQTVLGNLILLILSMLPQVKNYNKNHSQIFQLLARFSQLGTEARIFMIEAKALEKLLNYFYWDCSPYNEEFLKEPRLPFDLNLKPEIGLPTPESSTEKKGTFAQLKRNMRLKKLVTDEPHYSYLVETVANLSRSLLNLQGSQTKYQLDQTNLQLTEHDQVLFLPSAEFLEKLICNATKPRIASSIAKAYMHFAVDENIAQKIWETVTFGIKEYEHHKVRPFLVLFQHLIEAKIDANQQVHCEFYLLEFFKFMQSHCQKYFQFMELMFDFVWKLYTRMPFVRYWIQSNPQSWEFLGEWLDKNKEPPLQFANNNNIQLMTRMNKTRAGKLNLQRYNKVQNQALYYYRSSIFNNMKNKVNTDLSSEVDLDILCVQDFKLVNGMKVDLLEDKLIPLVQSGTIMTDLDEIVQVRIQQDDATQDSFHWILTQKCKIFQAGLIQETYKYKEIQRLTLLIQKRAEIEAQNKAKQLQEQAQARAQANQTNAGGYYYHQQVSDDDDADEDMAEVGAQLQSQNQGNVQRNRQDGTQDADVDFENDNEFRADSTEQNYDVDVDQNGFDDFESGNLSD